jgi:uncharacterized protein (TIGR01777 family)
MRIVVTGISGLIGSAVAKHLGGAGHEVIGVSRSPEAGQIGWDIDAGRLDPAAFEGVDAVVHLAGELIDGRWTAAKKQRILNSRVAGTRLVADTISRVDGGPEVLVSASAIGYYGDRGDETLTEQSTRGDLFLSSVCEAWEDATRPAAAAGIRVVNARMALVLSADGGALKRLRLIFLLGGGGRLGSGRQIWSWITLPDAAGVYAHLLTADVEGPVNVAAPNPVDNATFAKSLGRVLHRPSLLPAPAFALRVVLGPMADEMVLASANVRPAVLEASGYQFLHPDLEPALRAVLDR